MHPPSIDELARSISDLGLPHPLAVQAARDSVSAGDPTAVRMAVREHGLRHKRSLLSPVINATGVLLHTNLGRAPLNDSWLESSVLGRTTNLEFDLESGKRGSRNARTASLVARACGAQAALIVNNGAAALLLVLAALANPRRVIVSRGELVEIGGGFRIPEVMESSGVELVEVGTTNRTRFSDYERAVLNGRQSGHPISLLLKVHQSNFAISGFTEAASVRQLSEIGLPVVVDIGSGLLDDNTPWLEGGPPSWLGDEPAARQTLESGAALVTFSGDKLLGGPQAGVIAGRSELVAACAAHPLARALRPGSLVLSVLQETMMAYLKRDGDAIPFWKMATTPVEVLRERAHALKVGRVLDCSAVAGGGSLPGLTLDSAGVCLSGNRLAALRNFEPPVIARERDGYTVVDLRSVDPKDDLLVSEALHTAIEDQPGTALDLA